MKKAGKSKKERQNKRIVREIVKKQIVISQESGMGKEQQESSLEELTNFIEFGAITNSPNPLLQLTTATSLEQETRETIEEGLENVPAARKEGEENKIRVYNEPQYLSSYENTGRENQEMDIQRNITMKALRTPVEMISGKETGNINMTAWRRDMVDKMPEARRREEGSEEYHTIRIEEQREETGLPFEDKKSERKYRAKI